MQRDAKLERLFEDWQKQPHLPKIEPLPEPVALEKDVDKDKLYITRYQNIVKDIEKDIYMTLLVNKYMVNYTEAQLTEVEEKIKNLAYWIVKQYNI